MSEINPTTHYKDAARIIRVKDAEYGLEYALYYQIPDDMEFEEASQIIQEVIDAAREDMPVPDAYSDHQFLELLAPLGFSSPNIRDLGNEW